LKKTGQCPKCSSLNVWNNSKVHEKGKRPTKRWIIVRLGNWPWNRKYAFKEEYVCMDCGYAEAYVDNEGLETIREYGGGVP